MEKLKLGIVLFTILILFALGLAASSHIGDSPTSRSVGQPKLCR
jgi:hypothetical protein